MPSKQAPPPMVSSPERDGFIDLSSDPKPTSEDVEMVSTHLDFQLISFSQL